MAAGTRVPVEKYLSTAYDPDCEYIDGEVLERNAGEFDHAGLQGIVFAALHSQRRQNGINIFPELRVQIGPTRFRIPDVTVIKGKGRSKILREPPFLCIEILSPEDRASRMEAKIDDYLNFGVPHIWVIDPRRAIGTAYFSSGTRETSDLLVTASPRIELNLAEVFRDLAEII